MTIIVTVIIIIIIVVVIIIITIVAQSITIAVMHFRWNPITGFIVIVLIVSETHFFYTKKLNFFLIFLFNFLFFFYSRISLKKLLFDYFFFLQCSYTLSSLNNKKRVDLNFHFKFLF